jgi:hypothetical protein
MCTLWRQDFNKRILILKMHGTNIKKNHLSGSPVREPSLKVLFMESVAERCPTTSFLTTSYHLAVS